MIRKQVIDVIVEQNGKILFLKRANDPNKGKLDIPGGFLEERESLEQGAIREFKEETGFDIEITSKLMELNYFDTEEKTANVFIGKVVGGNIKNSDEGEPVWIKLEEIKGSNLSVPQQFIPILLEYSKHFSKKLTLM